jgi:hypothetical protein
MLILVPHVYILQLNRSAVLKCLLLIESGNYLYATSINERS